MNRSLIQWFWCRLIYIRYSVNISPHQPPPQGLCFSQGREATGDEPQGTMGRVQTAGVVSFPPSFARTFSSRERGLGTRQSPHTKRSLSLISLFHFHYSLYTLNCRWSLVFHVSQVIFLKIIIQNCFKLES